MELRRLTTPFESYVRSAIDTFDCGNAQVNRFLRHYAEPIVDHRLGTVQATVARARRVSESVAVRYLVADANPDRVGWYRAHGWVENGARKEQDRLAGRSLTSMRFDLGSATR